MTLGTLIQVDAGTGLDRREDGFEVRAARLRLNGSAHALRFYIQTEFRNDVSLFDARLRVPLHERVRLTTGLYKTPFSIEFIRFRGALRTFERSRVSDALAPRRQVGGHLTVDLIPGALALDAGVFNGNGAALENDDRTFLYVTRASGSAEVARETTVEWGVNAAASNDTNAPVPPVAGGRLDGERRVIGADVNLTYGRWLLAAEGIVASFDPDAGGSTTPVGAYVTAGVRPAERHRIVLRYDTFDRDRPDVRDPDQVRLGYEFFASDLIRLEAKVGTDVPDIESTSAAVRLQVAVR